MINPIKTTDFDAVKLKLASPEDIMSWSHGEVVRPETINYRTQKPEKDGLFCEKIFGPSKDWECYCGKYKKIRYKGIVCDKCGVEVTRSIVRRERMGHIELQTPCTHIWFLRGLSSKIGLLLDLTMQAMEKVVYFASFIITDVDEELKESTIEQIKNEFKQKKKQIENEYNNQVKEIKKTSKKEENLDKHNDIEGKTKDEKIDFLEKARDEKIDALQNAFNQAQKELKDLKPFLIVSEDIYQNLSLKYGHIFEAGIGAEAIRTLLERVDLKKSIEKLEEDLETVLESKKEKMMRRLKLLRSLLVNDIRPEWMVLKVIPIIPPDLRPMVPLDGGRYATSDLNDLYRRVINRNNRLKQLIELNAPEVICRNEKRMLQEAVDALIDNSARHGKTVIASTGQKRMLKSLADSLKGKQGRFRQNLLGKRIDYSGRSVIVVNPKLKLYQCGLPKVMALELFKPFVISKLIENEIVHNVRSASKFIETEVDVVWDILEDIIQEAYVMLNRAPTLHRLGIQAFKPTLIDGKAIQIHPLVCSAFNADFDGDQMAVHVPLTKEAIHEAKNIILSAKNLLKPATGDPVVAPSQDIVWGVFYITQDVPIAKDKKIKYFSSEEEARFFYDAGKIELRDVINVKIDNGSFIKTTIGRVILNNILPEKLRFINEVIDKGRLKRIVKDCFRYYGEERTVQLLDELKDKAFRFVTKSGLSWGMDDLPEFSEKDKLLDNTQEKVDLIQEQYEEGLLTDSERYSKVVESWSIAKDKVTDICKKGLPVDGPVYSMIESGARGSWAQLTQILGMKGLVTSPSGDIIELPIKGNFKQGFGVLEYFNATHGVRKGLSDTALRTASAGYLTRRLVDVSQDVIITEEDCGDTEGIVITEKESLDMNTDIKTRILGRFLADDLKNEKGKVLVEKDTLINEDIFDKIKNENILEANIRTVLNCKLGRGVCSKCYGWDLGHNSLVKKGVAVGVVAAQSIGEPGTQLTMRTFHTGGIAGVEDITQGLPRVEEIFETRIPKKKAIISEFDGYVKIETVSRSIEDESGKMIVKDSNTKVLKIYYKEDSLDKYSFAEARKKAKLSLKKEKNNNKEKQVEKIMVKDGQSVQSGDVLFKIGKVEFEAKYDGVVHVNDKDIIVDIEEEKVKEFTISRGVGILVEDGQEIKKGDQLTDGSLDLQQAFKLRGCLSVQKYIIKEIQDVYASQGQPLNDKHVEIIAKQMFSRYLIIDPKDTDLLPGDVVENASLQRANEKVREEGKEEAVVEQLLRGITKASLTTDSFLSSASFQETARILIEASISGKIDYLEGLKENVIIGRLIPAGTGYKGKKVREKY